MYDSLTSIVTVSNSWRLSLTVATTSLFDDHRVLVPPDPIPNSAVKQYIADGSVGFPHVRVGHRQTLILKCLDQLIGAFYYVLPNSHVRGRKNAPAFSALPPSLAVVGHTQSIRFAHGAGSRQTLFLKP